MPRGDVSQVRALFTFDFSSRPDPQALTQIGYATAAYYLVEALAGDQLTSPAFWQHVEEVRDGADASEVAPTWYLPRNATSHPRRMVEKILRTAASADRPRADHRLLALTTVGSVRALDSDDHAVAEPGDRRYSLRADWRERNRLGGRLLALRGAGRCLACSEELRADEFYRVHEGPLVDRTGRADYCDGCEAEDSAELARPRHRAAIFEVLREAAPAILGYSIKTTRP